MLVKKSCFNLNKKLTFVISVVMLFRMLPQYCFGETEKENHSLKTPEYFVEQGNFLKSQHKNKEAQELYQKALEFNQNSAEAHLGLASVYARMKAYDKAIAEYERAMQNDPGVATKALPSLIFIHLLKDDVKAVEYFKKLYSIDSSLANALFKHIFYSRMFGFEETEDGLETKKILTMIKGEWSDDVFRADSLYGEGKHKESVDEYKKILNKNLPFEVKAAIYNAIGNILFELNRPEDALSYLEKAIDLNPNEFALRIGLVDAYRSMGDFSRALEETEKILKLDQNNKYGLYVKGSLYFKMAQWQDAVSNWDKLKEVDKILFAMINDYYRDAKEKLKNK